MGVRVLTDRKYAALYDSVGMIAFGPLFSDEELFESPEHAAYDFLNWLQEERGIDARVRRHTDLVADRRVWLSERNAQRRRAARLERGIGVADPNCAVCDGTGSVRNRGDDFTTTVEAAAAYEQAHGGMPDTRTCKCWFAPKGEDGAPLEAIT